VANRRRGSPFAGDVRDETLDLQPDGSQLFLEDRDNAVAPNNPEACYDAVAERDGDALAGYDREVPTDVLVVVHREPRR
jgi:hypothetical protein